LMNNNVNAEKSCCCHEFVVLPPSAVLAHNLQVRVSFSTADGARGHTPESTRSHCERRRRQ
jgi:hypothetical protein